MGNNRSIALRANYSASRLNLARYAGWFSRPCLYVCKRSIIASIVKGVEVIH